MSPDLGNKVLRPGAAGSPEASFQKIGTEMELHQTGSLGKTVPRSIEKPSLLLDHPIFPT
jgi:hypothetical protein